MGKTIELGERKHSRIEFQKAAFVILEPDGVWIECSIMDISDRRPASLEDIRTGDDPRR